MRFGGIPEAEITPLFAEALASSRRSPQKLAEARRASQSFAELRTASHTRTGEAARVWGRKATRLATAISVAPTAPTLRLLQALHILA